MIRTDSDVKYLTERLKQVFKKATKYSFPDSGDMMELGSIINEIQLELMTIPKLQEKIAELETEKAKLIIASNTNV